MVRVPLTSGVCALGLAILASLPSQAHAQAQQPPVALVDARIDGFDEPVTILINNGRIQAVAPGLPTPRGVQGIQLEGRRVVPGRVDLWSQVAGQSPLGRAWDAFDPYDRDTWAELHQLGVTALCLTPNRDTPGLAGVASIIRLLPTPGTDGILEVEEAAVCASFGGPDTPALTRAQTFGELQQALRDASRYRDAWTDYEAALAEYLEAIGEDDPAPVDDGDDDGDNALRPLFSCEIPLEHPYPIGLPQDHTGHEHAEGGADDEDEDDTPEAPEEPPTDRVNELLRRVLDGALPLRIHAERAEDIVNALELKAEFGIEVWIEGGAEATHVAAALARAEVPVILGPAPAPAPRDFPLQLDPSRAQRLHAAGVPLLWGTGALTRSRHLPLWASEAVGAGLDPAVVRDALGPRAWSRLNLTPRLGVIAEGSRGDLVVLDDPDDPSSVRAVLVEGRLVWSRP